MVCFALYSDKDNTFRKKKTTNSLLSTCLGCGSLYPSWIFLAIWRAFIFGYGDPPREKNERSELSLLPLLNLVALQLLICSHNNYSANVVFRWPSVWCISVKSVLLSLCGQYSRGNINLKYKMKLTDGEDFIKENSITPSAKRGNQSINQSVNQ